MKCRNCGTEFEEGFFCPECGTKIEEGEITERIIQQPENGEEKIPWYLSIWFIILISVLSFGLLWIPATILGIIRFCKYKKRRTGVAILNFALLVPSVIVITVMIIDAQKEGKLNSYIKTGQYLEAKQYIDQEYEEGSFSYTNALAQLYEEQGLYDEAACLWVKYYKENYTLLDLSDSAISKLKRYTENHGEALKEESISQIETLIMDKEKAEAEEQAAKEAKAAEKQAAKEAKAAEEQAAKEAKAAEEQAAKEAKAAEEQAAKETKEAEEQAAREAKEAEEQKIKEEKAADEQEKGEQQIEKREDSEEKRTEKEFEQEWIEDDIYSESTMDEWEKDYTNIFDQVENSFCSIFDISYHNEGQSDKLMKYYKKVLEAKNTDFINVKYDKKSYLKDTYQYKQTMEYSDYKYYGEMKDGLPNGQGCVVRYVSNYGVYLPWVLGNFKKGQLNGYVILFSNEYACFVAAEVNYKMGEKDGDYVAHAISIGGDESIYAFDIFSNYIMNRKYEEESAIDAPTPIITDVPFMSTYHNEIGKYNNNKMVGKWIHYDVNQNILADIKMKSNGKTGKGTIYYSAGKKKYEGELRYYQDQLQYHGKGTLYREDGSIEYEGKFKNGKIDN